MVSFSTLSTDMWTAVKNICVTAISDAGLSANVQPVFVAKPVSKPLVAIPPISTPKTLNKFNGSTANNNNGRYDVTVVIYCYARNTLDVDNLKQAILNGLESTSISGASLSSFDDDYDFTEINDAVYHLITISASYIVE